MTREEGGRNGTYREREERAEREGEVKGGGREGERACVGETVCVGVGFVVCVCVCVRACVCLCVCDRDRGRERQRAQARACALASAQVRKQERVRVFVCLNVRQCDYQQYPLCHCI